MMYEQKFEATEPLREALNGVKEGHDASNRPVVVSLFLLLTMATIVWASYGWWSSPILDWLKAESAPATAKTTQSAKRTTELQMLIDETQGELADVVVMGEGAKEVNAALPFFDQPIPVAQSFHLAGTTTANAQRAQTCLTQAVYYEAGFESLAGKRAVAQVILNRMKHPAFPSSVCGVVYQGFQARVCQFSFTCDGALFRKPQNAAWASSRSVAVAALGGHVERTVGTATHYHADYVSPHWAPKLAKIAQLGTHIFYAWPGAWGRRAAFSSRYTGSEFLPSLRMVQKPPEPIGASEAVSFAETGLSVPPALTDRHAKIDVGGRLDVNRGWTLRIPNPSETRESFAKLTNNQHGSISSDKAGSEGGGL